MNLLEDHLVDLLLDVAVTGINKVEREGISVEHPASFVLIGSGNPEEGELRPQLLDRFGLAVDILDEKKIASLKMGALLSVAQGGPEPPRMIVITYTPANLKPDAPVIGLT